MVKLKNKINNMKYLKLFENKVLDDILDKISKDGMDSLTDLEKDFLDKFGDNKHQQAETKIKEREKNYKGVLSYDPREDDTDFYKEAGKDFGIDNMNFDDWSDEEIEDGKYSHLWDGLYDEDMDSFMRQYKIPEELSQMPWDKLPVKVKENFRKYIKDIGMLD